MGQENWETIFFPAKWQSCSPAQPELLQTVFGLCKSQYRAYSYSPSCVRTNRAEPGTIYFTRIDTAMESWKSLWIFDCWRPEDAPGLSYLPCCHELLGSSRVCWHWAASNLQEFSILKGKMHWQNVQASLRCLGHPKKFTVMAESCAICTKAHQGAQHENGGLILGWRSKPMKIGKKIHISLEPEFPLPNLQRWDTQNNSFIGVQIVMLCM